jgi:hypothetical protein
LEDTKMTTNTAPAITTPSTNTDAILEMDTESVEVTPATEVAKVTETKVPAQRTKTPGEIAFWVLRPNVDEVIANWKNKIPQVHDRAGKCMKKLPERFETRAWVIERLDENVALEADDKPRTVHFCTRCVVMPKDAPAKADKAPAAAKADAPKGTVEDDLETAFVAAEEEPERTVTEIREAIKAEPKVTVKRTTTPRKRTARNTGK